MKIGYTKGGARIRMTAAEQAILGAKRADVTITPNAKDYIELRGNPGGRCSIFPTREGFELAIPSDMAVAAFGRNYFGSEAVKTRSREKSILIGDRPTMEVEVRRVNRTKIPIVNESKSGTDLNLSLLRQAVKLINNMRKTSPREIELSIDERGFLKLNILISM
jgi:hypothetical protein